MDESRLINECAVGNKDAMALLYNQYSPRMLKIIRKYVHDSIYTEDILHDGFVIIFTRIAEVRKPESLGVWMGTIMKNLCIHYLSLIDVETILDEEISIDDTPDLDDILTYEELETIINKLPEGYKTIFRLYVFEHKTHKEIAEILGINPHSSSSQLHHAKIFLRRLIAEHRALMATVLLIIITSLGYIINHTPEIDSDYHSVNSINTKDIHAKVKESSLKIGQLVCVNNKVNIKNIIIADSLRPIDRQDSETNSHNNDSIPIPVLNNNTITDSNPSDSNVLVVEHKSTPIISSESDQIKHYNPSVLDQYSSDSKKWNISFDISSELLIQSTSSKNGNYQNQILGDDINNNDSTKSTRAQFQYNGELIDLSVENDFPITLGFRIARNIYDNWSIESGIDYSFAHSKISVNNSNSKTLLNMTNHYIGVPLKFNYRLIHTSHFNTYLSTGVSVDIPLHTSYNRQEKEAFDKLYHLKQFTRKCQWSTSVGIGLQYTFTKNIGIFTEPSLRINFHNSSSMPSYWQDHTYTPSIPIGIRIDF